MQRAAVLQASLMISAILLSSIPTASADGPDTVIEANVTWAGDQSVEGTVRIVGGGHLTVDQADLTMADGSSIVIEAGGILTLSHAGLLAANPPTVIASMGYWDEANRSAFKVPGEGIDGPFDVTMLAMNGDSYFGDGAHIGGEAINLGTGDANDGSSHTFSFEDGAGDVWVGLTGFSSTSVTVASITIVVENGGSTTILGTDLESVNMKTAGDPGFSIQVDGTLSSVDSTVSGGQITVSASMNADDSTFDRVGPILLEGSEAAIDLRGATTFSGSLDDHDVRGDAYSTIYWGDDVAGSGGLIDRWERRVSEQSIQLDAKYVILSVGGIGPSEATHEIFSDENGTALVDGGQERVVEIGYSDGTVWSESATIEVISYVTAWNPESSGIGNYGGGSVPLTWEQTITMSSGVPYIEWESLDIEGEESSKSTSQSMPVHARMANRGTASALLYFTCDATVASIDEDGNVTETVAAADIGGYQGGRIEAGESVEMQFGWRGSEAGQASLTCRILTPTQLVDENAFGGGSMTTGVMTWTEPVDEDSLPMLPLLAALVVAMVIAGASMLRRASDAIVETEEEILSYSRDEDA
ncbi:hypothetical protein [Candidatus Thalassarchaeum betae]|uniref:hypothetical protein n=1 Tax=Candidatus Thalassarchaeum betae TaxID=2599289 RepID=UPI0030C6885E|nr:hypothetical protein [Candidatus Thalassoarchaea betae]